MVKFYQYLRSQLVLYRNTLKGILLYIPCKQNPLSKMEQVVRRLTGLKLVVRVLHNRIPPTKVSSDVQPDVQSGNQTENPCNLPPDIQPEVQSDFFHPKPVKQIPS